MIGRPKKTSCNRHLIKFDASQHYFQFFLPDGRTRFKTRAGGILSIIVGVLILTYAVTQFTVYWMREKYTITEKSYRNSLKELDNFNKKNRFPVAAAMDSPDG